MPCIYTSYIHCLWVYAYITAILLPYKMVVSMWKYTDYAHAGTWSIWKIIPTTETRVKLFYFYIQAVMRFYLDHMLMALLSNVKLPILVANNS